MVELALAAAAMIFWINAEPGLARAFAFNVMLIGGVSTLLFNGNPLLRFDGYFVLSDILEMPNLATRANKYFWYLVQRYLLGVKKAQSPITARGERGWFLLYSVAAFVYRIFISIAISLFIASKLFFVGIILAVWALSNVFVFPIFKGIRFILTDKALRGNRRRAVGLATVAVAMLGGGLFVLPVPYATLADGVVIFDENQIVRADTGGFIEEVVDDGAQVNAGDVLVRVSDPALDSQTRLAEARLAEIKLRLDSTSLADQTRVTIYREQQAFLSQRLEHFNDLQDGLETRASQNAQVVIPGSGDMIGRLTEKGAVLGYLKTDAPPRLRVAVSETSADLVRNRTLGTAIRFRSDLKTVVPAQIVAAPSEGMAILPSPGLSTDAGSSLVRDPTDPDGLRTLQTIFTFDLVPDVPVSPLMGERAVVRFDHGYEPIGYRMIRAARQLFLRQFNV